MCITYLLSNVFITGVEDSLPAGWKVVRDLDDLDKLLDPQGILGNMDMSNK